MGDNDLKKINYFVGVDTSKDELDFAVLKDNVFLIHKECRNEPKEIAALVDELKTFKGFTTGKTLFCIEDTGMYCNPLLSHLKKTKAKIVLELPIRIKRSLGLVRGKNDRIDAIRIAQYASRYKDNLRLLSEKRPVVEMLRELLSLRSRIQSLNDGIKKRLSERARFDKKYINQKSSKLCGRTLAAMKEDLEEIEHEIDSLVENDPNISRLLAIVSSVPNVGRITALHIIVYSNEFKNIRTAKKFACFAGIAPFKIESGKNEGKAKISRIANRKMKSLLHLCAVSALRHPNEFSHYAERKIAEGKHKMKVLNAVRNKIILRVYTCVKEDRVYVKYENKELAASVLGTVNGKTTK